MKISIPLRFVETHKSAGEAMLHPDAHIQAAVERANNIWDSVGIEFWIRSIERYYMPHLNRYIRDKDKDPEGCPGGTYCFTWADVRTELRQVFPHMPLSAYPDTDKKSSAYWLHAASALYGDPNELLVWLVDESGSSGNGAPWTGRMVYIRKNGLWADEIGGANTTLAHEMGHFLGPRHNNDSECPPGYQNCDRWDHIFLPGNPNTFFSSSSDPKCDASKVKYIAAEMTALIDTPFGPVHAVINGQNYTASGSAVDVALKGLFRPTGQSHNPPQSWGFAMNVMGGIPLDGIDGTVPRFFSESQARMISDFLGRDVDFSQDNKDRWCTSTGQVPVGAVQAGLTSLRTKLGKNFRGKISGQPAAVSWGPDRLDVFVRADTGRLWHKRYSGDKGWSFWRDLGGRLTSDPTVVSWGPDRLDVFARGFDGQLAHIRYSGDQGWSDWRDLGGRLTSAPAAVSWGPDRLDVFVSGSTQQLAHKRYSGDQGWSDWRDLGGRLTSAPAAVSWGLGRLDVFVSGSTQQLAHKRYSSDQGWSDWRDLGGRLTSPPAVVSWGPDRLDVLVSGFSHQLAHKRYSGDKGWSGWRDLGGRLTSAPTVVSWGANRLDVFVRGFTEQPAHQRYSGDQGWSGWRVL